MATEADLIQKFKDLNIPVGADFEELIHAAFAGSNLADIVNSYDSRIATVETDLTTKADDSKVVHSTDMRKPASDVAGIEEVSAKQDKIGYTPADDSKVLHSTVTQLNSTDMNTVLTAGFYRSFNGTNGIPSGDNFTIYQVIILSDNRGNGVQLAYGTNSVILGMRSWSSYGTNFTSWVQFADDSKVAHLSGANNFDTVPTVKNNPLLLASSLPSDLARTSQQTNFTAGLQSGGVDVATAADLKSVADKAWYIKSLPDVPALKNISLLYQVDDTNKKMNIVLNGNYSSATAGDSTGLLIADFSDIIQGITSIIMKNNTNKSGFFYYDQNMQQSPNMANQVNIVFSGTKLYMNTGSNSYPRLQIAGADYLCLMYGSTISYTELV